MASHIRIKSGSASNVEDRPRNHANRKGFGGGGRLPSGFGHLAATAARESAHPDHRPRRTPAAGANREALANQAAAAAEHSAQAVPGETPAEQAFRLATESRQETALAASEDNKAKTELRRAKADGIVTAEERRAVTDHRNLSRQHEATAKALQQRSNAAAIAAGSNALGAEGIARFDLQFEAGSVANMRQIDGIMDRMSKVLRHGGHKRGADPLLAGVGDRYRTNAIDATNNPQAGITASLVARHDSVSALVGQVFNADGQLSAAERAVTEQLGTVSTRLHDRLEIQPALTYLKWRKMRADMIRAADVDHKRTASENAKIAKYARKADASAMRSSSEAMALVVAGAFDNLVTDGAGADLLAMLDESIDHARTLFIDAGRPADEVLGGAGDAFRTGAITAATDPSAGSYAGLLAQSAALGEALARLTEADGQTSANESQALLRHSLAHGRTETGLLKVKVEEFRNAFSAYEQVTARTDASPSEIAQAKAFLEQKFNETLAATSAKRLPANVLAQLQASFSHHLAEGDAQAAAVDDRQLNYAAAILASRNMDGGMLASERAASLRTAELKALADPNHAIDDAALADGLVLGKQLKTQALADDGIIAPDEAAVLTDYTEGLELTVRNANDNGELLARLDRVYADAAAKGDAHGMALANSLTTLVISAEANAPAETSRVDPLAAYSVSPESITKNFHGDGELARLDAAARAGDDHAVRAWIRQALGLNADGSMAQHADVTKAGGFSVIAVNKNRALDTRLRKLSQETRQRIEDWVNDEKYRTAQVAMLYDTVTGQYHAWDGSDGVHKIHKFDADRAVGTTWRIELSAKSLKNLRAASATRRQHEQAQDSAIAAIDQQLAALDAEDAKALALFSADGDRVAFDAYSIRSAGQRASLEHQRLDVIRQPGVQTAGAGGIDWGLNRRAVQQATQADVEHAKRIAVKLPPEQAELVLASVGDPEAIGTQVRIMLGVGVDGLSSPGVVPGREAGNAIKIVRNFEHATDRLKALPEWVRLRYEGPVNAELVQALEHAHHRDSAVGNYHYVRFYRFHADPEAPSERFRSSLGADGVHKVELDQPSDWIDEILMPIVTVVAAIVVTVVTWGYGAPAAFTAAMGTLGVQSAAGVAIAAGTLAAAATQELYHSVRAVEAGIENGDPLQALLNGPIERGIDAGIKSGNPLLGLQVAARNVLPLIPVYGAIVNNVWTAAEAFDDGEVLVGLKSLGQAVLGAAGAAGFGGGPLLGKDIATFASRFQGAGLSTVFDVYNFARLIDEGDGPGALKAGLSLVQSTINSTISGASRNDGNYFDAFVDSLPGASALQLARSLYADPVGTFRDLLGIAPDGSVNESELNRLIHDGPRNPFAVRDLLGMTQEERNTQMRHLWGDVDQFEGLAPIPSPPPALPTSEPASGGVSPPAAGGHNPAGGGQTRSGGAVPAAPRATPVASAPAHEGAPGADTTPAVPGGGPRQPAGGTDGAGADDLLLQGRSDLTGLVPGLGLEVPLLTEVPRPPFAPTAPVDHTLTFDPSRWGIVLGGVAPPTRLEGTGKAPGQVANAGLLFALDQNGDWAEYSMVNSPRVAGLPGQPRVGTGQTLSQDPNRALQLTYRITKPFTGLVNVKVQGTETSNGDSFPDGKLSGQVAVLGSPLDLAEAAAKRSPSLHAKMVVLAAEASRASGYIPLMGVFGQATVIVKDGKVESFENDGVPYTPEQFFDKTMDTALDKITAFPASQQDTLHEWLHSPLPPPGFGN